MLNLVLGAVVDIVGTKTLHLKLRVRLVVVHTYFYKFIKRFFTYTIVRYKLYKMKS